MLFILFQTDGNASFLRAARAGNLEKVLEYLKGSTDINTSNAVSTMGFTSLELKPCGVEFILGNIKYVNISYNFLAMKWHKKSKIEILPHGIH